jgi:hypothetical protein
MRKEVTSLPPLVIFPLEEFAGDSDVPCDDTLAISEAMELAEPPGGKHTFGTACRTTDRVSELESATDRLFEDAYASLE